MTTSTAAIVPEKKYVVIDLEGADLFKDPHMVTESNPQACILEVGLVVLNGETLAEEHRQSWLVLPPGVSDENTFNVWETNLRERNAFVFKMHSTATPSTDTEAGIPMLQLWMPNLLKSLSYRIMDVSVLRTFYQDITRVQNFPPGLADAIKTGGGGHRALSDCLYCAEALRKLKTYAANADAGIPFVEDKPGFES